MVAFDIYIHIYNFNSNLLLNWRDILITFKKKLTRNCIYKMIYKKKTNKQTQNQTNATNT